MKLRFLNILVLILIEIDGQSAVRRELREKLGTYYLFSILPYYVIQVCSNITGSLDWTYIYAMIRIGIQIASTSTADMSSTDTGSYRTRLLVQLNWEMKKRLSL